MDLRQQLQDTLGATYTLERELGGGGMSRVFVADERRLNRKVVIKLLSPQLAAAVNAERFEREIQLAASLQQANIVPILAAGDTQGLPFYAMPFVEGESLRSRLEKEGSLPANEAINVLRDIAKALAYAHERGVVHRDIKPDNVLLSGGTAVVTDFGIAKAISAARSPVDGGTLTQLGTSLGTPAYMSPEQAAGDPAVDHRADIYSFGCLAYELLTGQAPFAGRTPARMIAAHMAEAPEPIAQRRPDLPPALANLVMRCLEKDPARRPTSGGEIVHKLDETAGGGIAVSGAPLLAPGAMGRSLALYAVTLVVVGLLAQRAVIALGLPDWVFPGALAVMLLGVPVFAFAWYANRTLARLAAVTPSGASAEPSGMGALALKATPHLTWRRTLIGGAALLGAFVLLVAAFMASRAWGIGPAGTLMSSGKLADRERLIVTEFQSSDSSLGTLVSEAVRTNLGQSRVISIMPPIAISASLQRMQRPPSSRIDLVLAREIAQREGVKAIVDGAIRSVGGGYIVSLRLVSADSAQDLAAMQQTADGPQELLEAIDKLTRRLRGRIGESLQQVRGSPPLEQVTTSSLEALRIYAEAARSIDMGGNLLEAADRLREAVRLDTAFAMAYRKLGVALSNSNLPMAQVDSALERAYRFRDRLTERERLLAEGTYFQLSRSRDRRRAIRAYEALLVIDSTETGAANNLGSILSGHRQFARAESLFKRQIVAGRATAQNYTNLIGALFNAGKIDEAERVFNDFRQRYPQSPAASYLPASFLYQRGQLDSLNDLGAELAKSPSRVLQANALAGLASYSLLRGKVDESFRYGERARRISDELGAVRRSFVIDSLDHSWVDLNYYEDTVRAVRRLETLLAKTDFRRIPFDQRPYIGMAVFFAKVRDLPRARSVLAQYDAEMPDSIAKRTLEPGRHFALGAIAEAEGRYVEAVRELWRADTTFDGPEGTCTICLFDDIGWVWNRAGVPDSAIYYWEKYLNTPQLGRQAFDAFTRPFVLKRLGELYESTGNVANAALRYREFVKLWERADPRLQPKVDDVQARIVRLADIERR